MKTLNRLECEWIESWTVEEAIAVYEFCTMMQDHLWRHHEIALSEHILEREGAGERQHGRDGAGEDNLELPFDEIPF